MFDKACLGGSSVGSASLVTSSWFLYEALHAHRLSDEVRQFLRGIGDLQRVWGHNEPKGWTTGLRKAIQGAWTRWKHECAQSTEIAQRKVLLAKLTEDEAYERHVAQDHVPYRKGCPVCISAQGRQRPHWRSSFPDMHTISVDIAGPFVAGQAFNVEASGRDRGGGYRYMLVFAYAIPNKFRTESSKDLEEYEPSECGQLEPDPEGLVGDSAPLDDDEELFPELFSLPGRGDEDELALKAVTHRVRHKRSEDVAIEGEQPSSMISPEPKERVGAHHTLFLGVPLRTKQGKEVLPQIQGVINKLEASGFPIHRYHSDRAKELRSAALIAWLKGQGIHPTWTAGESPAGNRAELAVQGLKGFMRKLLAVSGLDKIYWPLALQHASTRNWINFNEMIGIPQPVLLPFGVKVHARRRTRTGFAAQWEPRTVAGIYVGHAPNTPGGHLVLVQEEDKLKVLLTNTIYPLKGSGDKVVKPRYRLRHKRSPPFVVRVVAARELDHESTCFARCTPGGESFSGSGGSDENFEADFELQSGVRVQNVSGYVGEGNDVSGLGEVPVCSVPPEGCGWFVEVFEDGTSDEESGDRDLALVGISKIGPMGHETCACIRGSLENQDFSDETCVRVLCEGLGALPRISRSMRSKGSGHAVLLGLYSLGGFRGCRLRR